MDLSAAAISQMLNYPLDAPPPGIVPNFEHPESNAYTTFICASVTLFLITIAMICHIYSLLGTTRRSLTWADGMLWVSAVGVVSWIFMIVGTVGAGAYGKHSWEVKLGSFTKGQVVLSSITTTLYPLWILAIKLSLFLLYLEVFGAKKWMRYCSYIGMAILTVLHLAFMLTFSITCRPRGGQSTVAWLAGFLSPQCTKGLTYNILQAVVNLVGDFYLLVLPLVAIWSLHMTTKKKLGISAMFLTGFCAIIAGIVALYYRLKTADGKDNTWRCLYNWNACMFEMTAGLLVVCMPSMAAAARKGLSMSKLTFSNLAARRSGSYESSKTASAPLQQQSSSIQSWGKSKQGQTRIVSRPMRMIRSQAYWNSDTGISASQSSVDRSSDDITIAETDRPQVSIIKTTEYQIERTGSVQK